MTEKYQISSETRELLSDFEKRMKFINIVKYFIQRSVPNNIRDLFESNADVLDNLIVMTMVFIMDHTLRYGEKCTKNDVQSFMREALPLYGLNDAHIADITDYILTDVLQNGGKPKEFDVYKSDKMSFGGTVCRLISENNGCYKLTDETYDFLFRTKEIDSELDFSVSRFKLNEFIKRGNYSKALSQSRELVSRIRGLKTNMDDFILRCSENVSSVAVDEYEEIIKRVRSVFEDEQKELENIRSIVSLRLEQIIDAMQNGIEVANGENTEKEIQEILDNIDITIREQSRVYNKKYSLSEKYKSRLDNDFIYHSLKIFGFEEEVLMPSRKLTAEGAGELYKLFTPLLKPRFNRFFSLESFYARQELRDDNKDSGFLDMTVSDDLLYSREEERNKRFVEIIKGFMAYSSAHAKFRISDFVRQIPSQELKFLCEENALFAVLLKLYGMGEINILQWKANRGNIIVPMGEFDMSYCLSEIDEGLLDMSVINVSRDGSVFEADLAGGLRVTIDDFEVEVKR